MTTYKTNKKKYKNTFKKLPFEILIRRRHCIKAMSQCAKNRLLHNTAVLLFMNIFCHLSRCSLISLN